MALIYFACPLDEYRPHWFRPLIMSVVLPIGDPTNIQWATSDGKTSKNWAVGVINATPAQTTAINAENSIQAMTASEIDQQFQALSQPRENRINTFLIANAIALPAPTETIRSIFDRVIATLDTKTLGSLEGQLS